MPCTTVARAQGKMIMEIDCPLKYDERVCRIQSIRSDKRANPRKMQSYGGNLALSPHFISNFRASQVGN